MKDQEKSKGNYRKKRFGRLRISSEKEKLFWGEWKGRVAYKKKIYYGLVKEIFYVQFERVTASRKDIR